MTDRYGSCPVIVRGETFPSQSAAARHFGVTPQVVSTLLARHGHLDTLGCRSRPNITHKKPLTIGGITFESRADAARKLGIGYSTLREWMTGPEPNAEKLLAAVMHYRERNRRGRTSHRGVQAGHIMPVLLAMPAEVQDAMELHCARTGETLAEAALRIWAEALAAAPQARKPSGQARTPDNHHSPSAGA